VYSAVLCGKPKSRPGINSYRRAASWGWTPQIDNGFAYIRTLN
jgi:hypothetical protein